MKTGDTARSSKINKRRHQSKLYAQDNGLQLWMDTALAQTGSLVI